MKTFYSLIVLTLCIQMSSAKTPVKSKLVDNVSDTMIAYTFFMQEDPKFVDILSYPISSNITKKDLMLLKQFNQMFPKRIKTNVKYRQVHNHCQKVSHHTYKIKAHKKGWLTSIEKFLTVTAKNHDTAHAIGKDAGRLYIICLETAESKTCTKDTKDFKFDGCKAIELKMNDEFLVEKYRVNDSMELKKVTPYNERKSKDKSSVISK